MIVFQSPGIAKNVSHRPCYSPSPGGEGRDEGELNSKLRIHHSKFSQNPLQSKFDQTHLKLITVNQTFLGPLPPPPVLSNLKLTNHCPVWIYRFGFYQKSVSFERVFFRGKTIRLPAIAA